MTDTKKIFYKFLKYSINELETKLDEIKPYLEESTDFNETLEYEKKKGLLKDLKEQLKSLENEIEKEIQ